MAQESVYSALATLRLLAARSSSAKVTPVAGVSKASGLTGVAAGKLPTVVETVEVEFGTSWAVSSGNTVVWPFVE